MGVGQAARGGAWERATSISLPKRHGGMPWANLPIADAEIHQLEYWAASSPVSKSLAQLG